MDIQEQLNNNWCYNMDDAPKDPIKTGERTIKTKKGDKVVDVMTPIMVWATDGDIITKSYFVNGERWNMFTKDNPPIAWQLFLKPTFKENK